MCIHIYIYIYVAIYRLNMYVCAAMYVYRSIYMCICIYMLAPRHPPRFTFSLFSEVLPSLPAPLLRSRSLHSREGRLSVVYGANRDRLYKKERPPIWKALVYITARGYSKKRGLHSDGKALLYIDAIQKSYTRKSASNLEGGFSLY